MKATHLSMASVVGAAALVAVVMVPSFWAFRRIAEPAEARKHTYDVINRAEALISAFKDAETGQRGYAITGDVAFLEPYLAVHDKVRDDLAELRRRTLIPAAHAHLDVLAPLMNAKLAEMSRVIDLRRHDDMKAVLAVVGSGEGKRLMDAIRAEMKSFVRLEEAALAGHEAEFGATMRRLFAVIVAASVLTVLFALAFALLIHRDTQHRLKGLVHLETKRLLEMQNETNQQLRQVNATLHISEEKLAVTLHSIGGRRAS